ncbi:hypothetical protein VTK73DRAFT_2680 [Phialemonium thermophilum]|uniref:Uncharacterized protein n=1 Tax=Phialemonium thermophilum TaxID=223376 RepID=A0ABR3VQ38_9PEZI
MYFCQHRPFWSFFERGAETREERLHLTVSRGLKICPRPNRNGPNRVDRGWQLTTSFFAKREKSKFEESRSPRKKKPRHLNQVRRLQLDVQVTGTTLVVQLHYCLPLLPKDQAYFLLPISIPSVVAKDDLHTLRSRKVDHSAPAATRHAGQPWQTGPSNRGRPKSNPARASKCPIRIRDSTMHAVLIGPTESRCIGEKYTGGCSVYAHYRKRYHLSPPTGSTTDRGAHSPCFG